MIIFENHYPNLFFNIIFSRFLREELSSTQLDPISSRSEVKVLLEDLATYKTGKESTEEFPDLLLSSLDKLYEDKQQQLWLVRDSLFQICIRFHLLHFQISGIHNSIENSKHKKCPSNKSISDCSSDKDANIGKKACDNRKENRKKENKESKEVDDEKDDAIDSPTVPNLTTLNLESEEIKEKSFAKRKTAPSLTLDLKKSYEFSPSSSPSWNRR